MKVSKLDYQKYSKQIILKKFGLFGQKKIMSSKTWKDYFRIIQYVRVSGYRFLEAIRMRKRRVKTFL